jgi:hypothetical protein
MVLISLVYKRSAWVLAIALGAVLSGAGSYYLGYNRGMFDAGCSEWARELLDDERLVTSIEAEGLPAVLEWVEESTTRNIELVDIAMPHSSGDIARLMRRAKDKGEAVLGRLRQHEAGE